MPSSHTALSTLNAALRAEMLRTKHSAAAWLPCLGLLLGGLNIFFPVIASGPRDATTLLAWQGMYVTGMAAPLTALFCVLTERRERSARHGGTHWRSFSPTVLRAARVLMLAGLLGAFTALSFGFSWCAALAQGYSGESGAGMGKILLAGLLSWWGQVGVLCVFLLFARVSNVILPMLLSLLWQFIGVFTAESPLWFLIPPAWPIRLMLPILGTHANLVPPMPGESLPQLWPVFMACTGLIVVAAAAAIALTPRTLRKQRKTQKPHHSRTLSIASSGAITYSSGVTSHPTLSGLLRTPLLIAHRRGIYPLILLTIAVLTYASVVYPPSFITGLTTFLILPVGTTILPVMMWGGVAPAWRITAFRRRGLHGAITLWHLSITGGMCFFATLCSIVAGEPPGSAAARAALWCATGAVLVLLWLLCTVRFSPGVALGLGIVSTIVSLTLGGDVLADTSLWLLALPSWGHTALSGTRLPLALVVCIALLVALIPLLHRAYRYHEVRG